MGRVEETPPSASTAGSGEIAEDSKRASPSRKDERSDCSYDHSEHERRRRDRRHKSGKRHRKSSRVVEASVEEQQPSPARYCHLEEAAVYENDHTRLKEMEREKRRRARRERRVEEREERVRGSTKATEPVYMPRSKYYPDPDDEPDSSSRSQSHHQHQARQTSSRHRHHHRRRHHSQHHGHHKSTPVNDETDHSIYVGPKTPSQVVKCLKPNEFCIYYQLPDKRASIPYKLRLFLAYMSSQNKEVFHFPIVCGKNARTGEDVWSLRYTDSATFPSLQALIKYHKIYSYMDPNTGKIDTFPVWKGAIINDDSYNE